MKLTFKQGDSIAITNNKEGYRKAIRYMMNNSKPWNDTTCDSNVKQYKRDVARRAKVYYGEDITIRVSSDVNFINDLIACGELILSEGI